ncbi:MAG TPA: hypothetical protein VIL49_10685 [Capillimicrobium sp.]|jgi:hypothetical protein
MHPAAHRALRELIATANLLSSRWARLADHAPDVAAPLRTGARDAEALADAFAALAGARDIAVGGAASGLGSTFGAGMARLGDPFLERNQSLRTAVLDIHHATVLLHYLQRLAEAESDGELADACREWAQRLLPTEGEVRDLAIAEGGDPDRAVQPVDGSPVGRAAHKVASAAGAAGEWVDRRLA